MFTGVKRARRMIDPTTCFRHRYLKCSLELFFLFLHFKKVNWLSELIRLLSSSGLWTIHGWWLQVNYGHIWLLFLTCSWISVCWCVWILPYTNIPAAIWYPIGDIMLNGSFSVKDPYHLVYTRYCILLNSQLHIKRIQMNTRACVHELLWRSGTKAI